MNRSPSVAGILWNLIQRDLMTLVKSPWIIISRTIFFLIQVFVFAAVITKLVPVGLDYFTFYTVGAVVSTITSIAFIIGSDLFEEEELGMLDYLLSLPFGHTVFVIGRALGGAVRSLIYTAPMMVLVAYLDGYYNPLGVLGSYAVLFVLALGISGLSITFAMVIRSENRFDVVIALAELATVRVSAAIYPIYYIPQAIRPVAAVSPVTSTSDLIRLIVLGTPAAGYDTVLLLLFVAVFFGLGSAFLFRKLEGGRFE